MLHQIILGFTVSEEGVLEKLLRCRPLGWLLHETRRYHVLELAGKLLAPGRGSLVVVGHEGEAVCDPHDQGLGGWEVGEGRAPVGELQGGDAEGPDVGLETVAVVGVDDLRGHPVGGAGEAAHELGGAEESDVVSRFVEGGRDPEVGQLHGAVGVDEDVAGLDVPVKMTLV